MHPARLLRLLVVDDNREFLSAERAFVESLGTVLVVGEATSGEDAIALASELAPDIVLMDLKLPGVGGIEATRRIKSFAKPPKVVMVTLHDHLEFRRAALAAGADGFIGKQDLATLLPPLLAVLGQGRPLASEGQ